MKIKFKTVLYWLSIVRPITDILIGAWQGIQAAISNAKLADEKEAIENMPEDLTPQELPMTFEVRLDKDGIYKTEHVNSLHDFEVIDNYFHKIEKEKKNG